MAEDLSRLIKELNQASEAADTAARRITVLTTNLEGLIRTATKGGTGTEAGIANATNRLLGTGASPANMRVGGGATISRAQDVVNRIDSAINQIIQERVNLAYNSLRASSLRNASRIVTPYSNASPDMQAKYNATMAATPESLREQDKIVFRNQLQDRINNDLKSVETSIEERKVLEQQQNRVVQETLATTKRIATETREALLAAASPEMRARYIATMGATPESIRQESLNERLGRYTQPFTSTGTWENFSGGGQTPFSAGPTDPGRIGDGQNALSIELQVGDALKKQLKSTQSISNEVKQKIIADITAIAKSFDPLLEKVDVLNVKLKSTGNIPEITADVIGAGKSKTYTGYVKGNQVLSKAELVGQRIQELLGNNPQALQDFYRRMESGGYGLENINRIQTESRSGRTIIKAREMDESTGAVREATIAYDKFGRSISVASRQHQGFFDSIVRNTGELIKWSIGIGIIYGGMYKLQQLVTMAIDNQTKLIDVNVALGNSQRSVNDIFEDADAVAKRTGESIGEVLDTYVIAYRAVGSVEDPIKRTTAANKLLYDATVLNKLSGLDASSAIDVLSGSLRQTASRSEDAASSFDRGRTMLDQWVKVTMKANIDLATLSTAFSVTSESALNSGMSIEQLNAVIASLSEKIGGLGGKETGNAVRALIGGVYQQQAVEILNRYGIAVQDSSGKMRDFMLISKDIYDLYQAGIIDEAQMNKIGYVLGGGVRRGQQYVAFLKDLKRVGEIEQVQMESEGAAATALGKKMDSVQTSTVLLSNAFQKLAQALGNEGGVLGSMSGLNTILATTVDFLTAITKLLGSVTLPATVLAALALYTGGFKNTGRTSQIMSPFVGLGGLVGNVGATRTSGGTYGQNGFTRETINQNALMFGIGNFISKYGLSMMLGMGAAAPRFAEGDKGGGIANLVGALAGGLLTKGSPIGVVIGSAMADSFYQGVISYKADFAGFFAEAVWSKAKATEAGTAETPTEAAQREINTALMGGGFAGGMGASKLSAEFTNWLNQLVSGLRQKWGLKPLSEQGYREWNTQEFALEQVKSMYGENSPVYQSILGKLEQAKGVNPLPVPLEQTAVFKYEQQAKLVLGPAMDALVKTQQESLRKQLIAGEITPKVYKEKFAETTGLPSTLIRLMGATNNMAVGGAGSELSRYASLFSNIGAEEKQILTDLTTQWYDLSKQIEDTKSMTAEALDPKTGKETGKTVGDLRKEYANVTQEIKDMITAMETANKTADLLNYQFMGNVTQQQMQSIMPQYTQMRDSILAAGGKSEETPLLTFFKDASSPVLMKADWAIVQYLLGEILKTNEKQLDGIYNLPSGASFYVPYQAWKMDTETRQAMDSETGGVAKLDSSMFQGNTEIFGVYVDRFGNYINNLAGNLTPEERSVLNKVAGEIKSGSHYKDWSMAKALEYKATLSTTKNGYPSGYGVVPENVGAGGFGVKPPSSPYMDKGTGFLDKSPTNTYDPSAIMREGMSNLFGGIWEWLKNLVTPTNASAAGLKYPEGYGIVPENVGAGGVTLPITETKVQPINTNFTLNLSTQTQLIVDGRMLADIIKPYLESDMLNSEGSTGSTVSLTVV